MLSAFAAVQLSVALTLPVTSGTDAWQLTPTATVNGPGTLTMVGAVKSEMVNETFTVLAFPSASVTVTTIVCVPVGRSVPAAGLWVMLNAFAAVQLSVALTLPMT